MNEKEETVPEIFLLFPQNLYSQMPFLNSAPCCCKNAKRKKNLLQNEKKITEKNNSERTLEKVLEKK